MLRSSTRDGREVVDASLSLLINKDHQVWHEDQHDFCCFLHFCIAGGSWAALSTFTVVKSSRNMAAVRLWMIREPREAGERRPWDSSRRGLVKCSYGRPMQANKIAVYAHIKSFYPFMAKASGVPRVLCTYVNLEMRFHSQLCISMG